MDDIANEIIEGLQEFTESLLNCEPIKVTHVECVKTPDGLIYYKTEGILETSKNGISNQ